MHRLKPFKEQLLFTLFLCAAILVMPFQDYTERALTAEMFHYSNSYSDCVTNADGTLTIQEHPEGILFDSDDFLEQMLRDDSALLEDYLLFISAKVQKDACRELVRRKH